MLKLSAIQANTLLKGADGRMYSSAAWVLLSTCTSEVVRNEVGIEPLVTSEEVSVCASSAALFSYVYYP